MVVGSWELKPDASSEPLEADNTNILVMTRNDIESEPIGVLVNISKGLEDNGFEKVDLISGFTVLELEHTVPGYVSFTFMARKRSDI